MKKNQKEELKKMHTLVIRATEIMAQLESYKSLYAELDQITSDLFAIGGVGMYGGGLELQGQRVLVVDNFAEKNVVFKPAAVRRYELKKI